MYLLFFLPFCFIPSDALSNCLPDELVAVDLIPRVADCCGESDLKIVFNKNIPEMKCGDSLTTLDVVQPPIIYLDVAGECKNVTILFIDPDGLYVDGSRGTNLHMAYVNVPACALKKGFNPSTSKKGDAVQPYLLPTGPNLKQKYVYFLYCQYSYVTPKPASLFYFDTKKFAEDNQLGDPIASSYFYLGALKQLKNLQLRPNLDIGQQALLN